MMKAVRYIFVILFGLFFGYIAGKEVIHWIFCDKNHYCYIFNRTETKKSTERSITLSADHMEYINADELLTDINKRKTNARIMRIRWNDSAKIYILLK